jgi:hypothetical protein
VGNSYFFFFRRVAAKISGIFLLNCHAEPNFSTFQFLPNPKSLFWYFYTRWSWISWNPSAEDKKFFHNLWIKFSSFFQTSFILPATHRQQVHFILGTPRPHPKHSFFCTSHMKPTEVQTKISSSFVLVQTNFSDINYTFIVLFTAFWAKTSKKFSAFRAELRILILLIELAGHHYMYITVVVLCARRYIVFHSLCQLFYLLTNDSKCSLKHSRKKVICKKRNDFQASEGKQGQKISALRAECKIEAKMTVVCKIKKRFPIIWEWKRTKNLALRAECKI